MPECWEGLWNRNNVGRYTSAKQQDTPKELQARLGHSKISTTLDTYGHRFSGFDQDAADALDGLRAGAIPSDGRDTDGTATGSLRS
jgi:hypothetical protein